MVSFFWIVARIRSAAFEHGFAREQEKRLIRKSRLALAVRVSWRPTPAAIVPRPLFVFRSRDGDGVGAGSSCAGLGIGLDWAVVGSWADSPPDRPVRDVGVPPDPRIPALIPSAVACCCSGCCDPRVFPSSISGLSVWRGARNNNRWRPGGNVHGRVLGGLWVQMSSPRMIRRWAILRKFEQAGMRFFWLLFLHMCWLDYHACGDGGCRR